MSPPSGRARGTSARPSVLIPTGRKMKGYGCMRSLHRQGLNPIVASEYETIPHFASRFCAERARLPSPWNGLRPYKDVLLAMAAREDVETVLPVRECDVYVFAKYAHEFANEVSLVVPTFDTLRTAQDRLRLAETAKRAGVPYARTRRLSEVDEWDTDVVVKSRFNLLTSEYVDSLSRDEAAEVKDVRFVPAGVEPDVGAIREAMRHDPIVQDFIPEADKHLYCALWADGEPLATYQHRQIRKNSWVGGGGVYRETTRSKAVEDAAYDLLHELDWNGLVCLEYLKDAETGEWKFLEVNPRVWQSLPEAVRAEADFPYYYWLCASGQHDRIDPTYDRGARCHNAYGEVGHLLSILRDESPFVERPSFSRTLVDIVASSLQYPQFDYIRRDDPLLFLSWLREALSGGMTRPREYRTEGEAPGPTPGQTPPAATESDRTEPSPEANREPIPARVGPDDAD